VAGRQVAQIAAQRPQAAHAPEVAEHRQVLGVHGVE